MNYILESEGRAYRKFFEDIAAIPHESFNEKALSDYIVRFAKARGLWYHQDQVWNVIVKKPASVGYENHDPVMIQGHLDMVCVKAPGSSHNFDTDPLQLYVEDGFLKAKGTTLGADCGHGISYMLAILDDLSLRHPPLECLFTVQEEVGIGGPKYLDYSLLSAKRLIFTDSMREGQPELSTTSVLGGSYIKQVKAAKPRENSCFLKISAGGLAGGHAAVDINKGRGNAIKLLARAAYQIMKEAELQICEFSGGTLKNNIPDQAEMIIAVRAKEETDSVSAGGMCSPDSAAVDTSAHISARLKVIVQELEQEARQEQKKTDPALFLRAEEVSKKNAAMLPEESQNVIHWLMEIPTGTYMASPEDLSFPLTSRNLGTAELIWEQKQHMTPHEAAKSAEGRESEEDHPVAERRAVFRVGYMFRTSVKSHMEMLFDEQEVLREIFGAIWEEEYAYPGYCVEAGSPMYQTYAAVYDEFTGETLRPVHIHAGTDVGTIMEGMGELDIIGIGPNTYNFHTPEEALDLASYDRAYQYITCVLQKL